MCGIFFSVAKHRPILPDSLTVDELSARGPDSYRELDVRLPTPGLDEFHLTFVSSVLALRGDSIQRQPLQDRDSGSILCWNGEAWKLDGVRVEGNDSVQIFDLLLRASHSAQSGGYQQRIAQALTNIAGPFAFVFYDAPHSTVYYGRDRLGRRSLLASHGDEDSLTLCSVGTPPVNVLDEEVSTDAIHFISFGYGEITRGELPWQNMFPLISKAGPLELLELIPTSRSVDRFLELLTGALELRLLDIPNHDHNRIMPQSTKVAILFSGGLDCTLLARLAHDILPKSEAIDLLNVAFENPRSMAVKNKTTDSPYELCPDRATGRSSFSELCEACPDREWRFVAVDVPYQHSKAYKARIQRLMHPHKTEMDLSITMALFFAAQGVGTLFKKTEVQPTTKELYTSHARVLVSGLGADELYAGYSRHAAAFGRGGFAALADELELDFNRIGSRNLGRDDRVMSHWGKEVRYPYLDEDLVRFSLGLPVWEKCGFRSSKRVSKHYEEVGRVEKPEDLEPSKMLLRLAMWKLGMRTVASERKRAIQFGARTAKMDIGRGRTKGTDVLVIGG
ncbi:uncharacterized protein Z519_03764 [Cladophialophora bantiana CBS 173.52]|uniref:Glutamine amidotransferase type-2 domain-containing protein n=1 Tax=Cladophialophora bantiana (strain ATCC 10958 / CBS 173.52 / CDC B-1940 / NIH 8579) TaxID=1442370 RepID=A0A0D2HW55_CLAB1|nr:uncharacterized protein Z519_03764 [Cladophialophora bantiana CBS 173.52]KIW95180.1 hypothetical protein Z519_03764 [Cladophialophora bantiana CBS 173.52]